MYFVKYFGGWLSTIGICLLSLVLAHFLKYNLNKGYRNHGVFEIDAIYKVLTVVVELIVTSNYMVFCGIWFIYDTILVVLQSTVPLSMTNKRTNQLANYETVCFTFLFLKYKALIMKNQVFNRNYLAYEPITLRKIKLRNFGAANVALPLSFFELNYYICILVFYYHGLTGDIQTHQIG